MRPLADGETALFIDSKQRRYLVGLKRGGSFATHAGMIPHDEVIGRPEGSVVRSNTDAVFLVFRPTLADSVLKMPRGAQVIYPKDLGPILMLADIFPGARVFETGLGSGALSATLLRAGAHVTGYELREDFANRARSNVEALLGSDALERYETEIRDSYEGVEARDMDRALLDLPEPWRVVPHLRKVLGPGGVVLAYTPSIVQVTQLHEALGREGFVLTQTVEVMNRTWHVAGASVRPDHRMVAHTGFLTHARLAAGTS